MIRLFCDEDFESFTNIRLKEGETGKFIIKARRVK